MQMTQESSDPDLNLNVAYLTLCNVNSMQWHMK